MFDQDYIRRAIIAAPAILFALTVHEYFHAWTAHKFGDDTAKNMGRLTLNPMAHLDLFGTIMLFVSQFRFGWAKPVPVNPMNLRNPRTAEIWISAAGPISNIGLAILFGAAFRVAIEFPAIPEALVLFLFLSVSINVSLAFFNMIPLFPLDGSHVLRNLLPPKYDSLFDRLQMISPIILILFIVTGAFGFLLGPIVSRVIMLFSGYGA